MSLSTDLINEIDKRIQKSLVNFNLLCRTSAKVVAIDPYLPKAQVVFYGDPKQEHFTFPYRRNYITLSIGDTVYVESKLNDLNSGIIVDKLFGIEEDRIQ